MRSLTIVFLPADQGLETLAYLSKIFEDTICLLCRLTNVDPFGDPCVKETRERIKENVERLFGLSDEARADPFLLYRLVKDVFSE